MREFHAGAEWDLHEVRYVWIDDGVFVGNDHPTHLIVSTKELLRFPRKKVRDSSFQEMPAIFGKKAANSKTPYFCGRGAGE